MKLKSTILIGCVITVTGCSSVPQTEKPQKISHVQTNQEMRIPNWYSNMPKSEGKIYSVGTAVATDLQMSNDIAILNAKTNLADRVNSKLNSQTKSFTAEVGSSNSLIGRQEIEKAVKNTIVDVDVAGYSVHKIETLMVGTTFRTFVMLEYSEEEATALAVNRNTRLANGSVPNAERAWKELDEERTKKK